MRLLRWTTQNELSLTNDLEGDIPPYAILSHTWGSDNDEVTFDDILKGQGLNKGGYAKLRFCGEQARRDGIEHFWVDTCCINKANEAELSQAIRSMFDWYKNAEKCYVFLTNVYARDSEDEHGGQRAWEPSFRQSRWFSRGWTLQELLAPKVVQFFSQEGVFLGDKRTLAQQVHEITTIPFMALDGVDLDQFSIDERIRWTDKRQTKKPEDGAYCLLGIFRVHMPLMYGEGMNAFKRLRKEINDRWGGNVAASLGAVDDVGASLSRRRTAPPEEGGDLSGQNNDPHQMAHVLQLGERTLTKLIKASGGINASGPGNIASTGTTVTNAGRPITTADLAQHLDQEPPKVFDSIDPSNPLLKSLLFDRIDFRINNVKRPLPSTCQWLFRHTCFQNWYKNINADAHSGFLWIKGKPGCGKSTLMKAAFEWAQRQKGNDNVQKTVIPYFFNARASASLEKSRLGLYRTVVYHLASSYLAFYRSFMLRFNLKDPASAGNDWTAEELQGFLEDIVESNEAFELYLFVDALDEAEYDDDVRQMIGFLTQLSGRAVNPDGSCMLRICLSSRHYPYIKIGRGLSLVVEAQTEHGRDIEKYVTKELTWAEGPEKDNLRDTILNKSARIFLWVVLVVRILNQLDDRGAPLSEVRDRLDTIPEDLNQLFAEILTKNDHGIETTMLLFQCMAFRMRPLEPNELFLAMEYSRSPHDPNWTLPADFSVPPQARLTRFILDCSRGLVEIAEGDRPHTSVVQFIHETVREFLVKKDGLTSIVPALAVNFTGSSHEILRIACLRRIPVSGVPEEYVQCCTAGHESQASWKSFISDMRLKLPFLDYAVLHLFDHAEQAEKHGVSQQAFLKDQFISSGLWNKSYRLWYNVFERYRIKKIAYDVSLAHFLVAQRYLTLLPILLRVSEMVNASCKKYGSLLQMVSETGDAEAVHILLDRGANVNAQGGFWGSALQAASVEGHEMIVKTLLDRGAHVNARCGHWGSAIVAASISGHEEIVRLLLENNADVSAKETLYGNALQAASYGGHDKVAQRLLDGGADVNAQGGYFGNALQAACVSGYEIMVQMLLDRGANVNAQGGSWGTALKAAAAGKYENIIQILRDRGADVNAQGGGWDKQPWSTLMSGQEYRLQIRRDRGTNTDANQGEHGNILYAALAKAYEKIAQTLWYNCAGVSTQ